MLRDARWVGGGATLEADVCIIGAGPAGITLALELMPRGVRILMLESGPEESRRPSRWSAGLRRGRGTRPFRLVRVAARFGARRRWLWWAEPDVGHAARLMRRVYEERDEARCRGERARADVGRQLSLQAIGELMKQRLLAIGERVAAGGHGAGPGGRVSA